MNETLQVKDFKKTLNAIKDAFIEKKKDRTYLRVDYNEKSIVFNSTKIFNNKMSEVYGVKSMLHDFYNKCINTQRYYQEKIDVIYKKKELNTEDNKTISDLLSKKAQATKHCQIISKIERDKLNELKTAITENVYPFYIDRLNNDGAWYGCIREFMSTNFKMEHLHETFLNHIDKMIGVKSASVQTYHHGFIKNMTDTEFSNLFIDILLDLACRKELVKNSISLAVATSSLDFTDDDYKQFNYVKREEVMTKKRIMDIISEFSLEGGAPKKSENVGAWKKYYNKLVRQGDIIEY